MLAGAAGVSVAAAMQRFGTGHLARRIDATDFAIMALALRKTASLISLGQLAGNAKGSSEAKAGAEKAVAAAGVAYGLAFAAAPTAARWIGAGIGAVAVSDAIDEVFAIAQQRSGPIEIIERRVTASPVKRFP